MSDGDGFADAPFGPPRFRVAANAEDATSYVTGLLDLECRVLVDAVAVIRASDVSGWFTRRDEAFLAAVRAVAGGRSTRRSVTTDAATTPSIGSTGCSSPGRTRCLAHSGRRCLTGVVGRRDEDATILLRRRRLNRLLHEDTSGRTAPDMLLVTCSTNDHMKCIRHRACYLRNIPVHLLRVTSLRNLVTETSPSRHLEFICTLSALSRILPRQQRVSWPARERQEARCTEGRDAGGFAQPP